ncbi:MAG: SDR family oxidoreductase [Chloroflexi bacterium]|nr:SDR family oxidoreductase [Chloroflexota bacterium]
MKIIVVTGSTRGIGYGLADSFLALGCAVTVSGRTPEAVEKAVAELSAKHQADHVFGQPCDVTDFEQVQALWDAAKARFDKIDIWINNAGLSNPQKDFWELAPERIQTIVSTNVIGAMYGSKVALRGMLDQGFGELYNMEGLGSDGRKVDGLALYGTTKSGLRYLNESLAQETKGTPVLVGALSPGMVVTDFLTAQYENRPPEDWENAKRIFNILADRVETVTPWLAQQVLANDKNGVCLQWLPAYKTMFRFLSAPFSKRNLFE